jgi:hypothetical protein
MRNETRIFVERKYPFENAHDYGGIHPNACEAVPAED